jgi:hypothetical protein
MQSKKAPPLRIRVKDVAWPSKADIGLQHLDVAVLDGLIKRCVASITSSLKGPTGRYSELQTVHLGWMFDAMGFTYDTIRTLLKQGTRTPACVDALALARLQLEALYSVCLMVQDPSFIDIYVKSFWRDNYVRFLLVSAECKDLRRFDEYLNQSGPVALEMSRQATGVTDEEKATVEFEELGTPMPVGMNETKIRPFPTPMKVIEKVTDPGQKRMLMRLYPEYRRLCGFAHGSAQAWMFRNAFWERSRLRSQLSEPQRQDVFHKEVLDPALLHSALAVIQGSCEVATTLYPADVELKRTVIDAWNLLSEMNLLGRTIWEIRARSALGVVGLSERDHRCHTSG